MIHYKGNVNGSGSPDPDRSGDKKDGDACEGNVYIINSEYRNMEHMLIMLGICSNLTKRILHVTVSFVLKTE